MDLCLGALSKEYGHYPPPDRLTTDDLYDESCQYADEYEDCDEPAVTTRFDDDERRWYPVCEDHRWR